MIRQREYLPAVLAALLVLFLPLPFGGVTPWAVAMSEVAAFLLLTMAVLVAPELRPLRGVRWPVLALTGLAALGWLQSLALPGGLVALLSPRHAALFRQAAILTGREVDGLAIPLSLAPSVSRSTALLVMAIAACLAAGALIGGQWRIRRGVVAALVVSAVTQVLFAVADHFEDQTAIWGVAVPSAPGRAHGTFVNPNHFAAYLGLVLPCALAWLWWGARRSREEETTERRLLWIAPPVLLAAVLAGGISLSVSRGALLAALVAGAVMTVLLAHYYHRWRWGLAAAAVALAGLGTAAWLGTSRGLSRLIETNPFDVSMGSRWIAWGATLDLWERFPVFGSGLGTFRDGFAMVQPQGLGRDWWHAHSDYLELLATAGVVGVLLLALGTAFLVRVLWRNFRYGHRSEDRATALAALGALAAIGTHEALDFALTMPANALTLALLCGIAAGVPVKLHKPQRP